jgi:hypothetical protein
MGVKHNRTWPADLADRVIVTACNSENQVTRKYYDALGAGNPRRHKVERHNGAYKYTTYHCFNVMEK